jgi:diaphanous 1
MPDDSLIAPTLLPTGALHFAAVKPDSIIQDVLDALKDLEDVREDILGDWQYDRWAVQKIRKEVQGRAWDERELEALSDGKPSFRVCRMRYLSVYQACYRLLRPHNLF